MIALHALLEEGARAGATPVCREHDTVHDFDAFCRRVRAIARAVQERPAQRYALCLENAFDFACALFALLTCAREPVIPGSFAPGYLAALAGAYDVLMTDDELRRLEAEGEAEAKTWIKTVKVAVEAGAKTSAKPKTPPPHGNPALRLDDMPGRIDPHAPLVLYTSGSSDAPKAIRKSLAQFDAEVATQERQWGALLGGPDMSATVLATVPHHHIYGILFRIFWPLAAGRMFDCNVVTDPAMLGARLGRAAFNDAGDAHGNADSDANDDSGPGTGNDADSRAGSNANRSASSNAGSNAGNDAGCVAADDVARDATRSSMNRAASQTPGCAAIVISTPAHLSRWPALPGFDSLGANLGARLTFFSSGGPLDAQTASLYAAKFGSAPIEIYGSTETGGIAWRRQNETQRWQPLPGVEVRIGADEDASGAADVPGAPDAQKDAPNSLATREDMPGRAPGNAQKEAAQNAHQNAPETAPENTRRDAPGRASKNPQENTLKGVLEIRSAHLGHDDWYRTDDEIALDVSSAFDAFGVPGAPDDKNAPRAFTLLGRLDRVVKIDGKRVSLAALEARLGAHPGIAQAVAVALDGKARTRVGVLAALSAAGHAALRQHGHARFAKALRQSLLAYFDPVAVPRQWRFVSALPFDARGKLPANVVRARFATHPLGFDLLSELWLEAENGGEYRYELRIPHDLTYFAGHFPGLPILPGVVQVDWAVKLAADRLGRAAAVAALDRLKFTEPVPPGAHLSLTLAHDVAHGRTRFVYVRSYGYEGHDGRDEQDEDARDAQGEHGARAERNGRDVPGAHGVHDERNTPAAPIERTAGEHNARAGRICASGILVWADAV